MKSSFLAMWTPAYTCLFFFEFFLQMGMQMSIPIVSNYALALGATVAAAGFLASLNSLCALVVRIFCGPLLSKLPMKAMLIGLSLIFCLSSLLCAVVENMAILAFCRLLMGIAIVGKSTLLIAFAALILPESQRGQGVAWLAICNVVAVALCPIACTYIGTAFGWGTAFLISGIFFLVAAGLSFFLKNPQRPGQKENDMPRKAPKRSLKSLLTSMFYVGGIPMCLVALMEGTAYGTVSTLTLTVGELRNIPDISLFFAAYVVISFIARPFSGKLYDQFGFKKVCAPMAVSIMLAMIVLAYAENIVAILAAGALFALGQGCMWPCMQAESVKGVSPENYSLSANTMLLGVDVGCSLGPIVGGLVLGLAGATVMYWANVFVGLILFLLVVFYDKLHGLFNRAQQ